METVDPMLAHIGENNRNTSNEKSEKKNQYIATICVSWGAVCAGTVLAWTSPVLPQLSYQNFVNESLSLENNTRTAVTGTENTTMSTSVMTNVTSTMASSDFYLTESEGSLVGAMLAIGALCSALPAGYIAEKFGRRKANLLLTVPFLINWLLIVFANGPCMLYVARFFSGVATGAMCVTAPMYIGEIADVDVRGTLGSFFQMFLCFGIFLTYTFGACLSWVHLSWVLMAFPILFAICLYFMPETPVYLVKIGHTSAAYKSLRYLRGPNYVVEAELKAIEKEIAKAEEKNAGVKDLIASRGNRKALITSLGLMVFQQLSGVNAVIFYTVPIFESAGSSLDPDLAAIIVSIVQFIIAYIAAMIIDKANRRFYLALSAIGMFLCLALLGLYFQLKLNNILFTGIGILPLASLVFFIVSFSLGFGPVPWMIMSELFAPEIKGIASGLTVMCNWAFVFVVTFSFPILNSSLGGHITFYFFAAVMALAATFVYLYVPETKGKTLADIQLLLNR